MFQQTQFECEIGRDKNIDDEGASFEIGKALTRKLENEEEDEIIWGASNWASTSFCEEYFRKLAGSCLGLRPGSKAKFRVTIERLGK